MKAANEFLSRLRSAPAVLVEVVATEGSVPREAGAWMAVFADGCVGTIGGGHLEFQAIRTAQVLLAADAAGTSVAAGAAADALSSHVLGPSLGQCCGGRVQLRHRWVAAADGATLAQRLLPPLRPVALFGGGHVGLALARVLLPLPFALTWIDSRDGVFPPDLGDEIACEHSDPVEGAVPALAAGSLVLVMSFSHAEDLDIVAHCLRRRAATRDLPFIGLIGSRTKWATFRHRLAERGFDDAALQAVTCPIGIDGIDGKAPEVIAVAIAAQLLQVAERLEPMAT